WATAERLAVPTAIDVPGVPPGKNSTVGAAGAFLPLGLGRQTIFATSAIRQPFTVGNSVVPADEGQGQVGEVVADAPGFRKTPAVARRAIRRSRICQVLSDRYRKSPKEVVRERDRVLWLLIGIGHWVGGRIAAHQECSGRDQDQLGLDVE